MRSLPMTDFDVRSSPACQTDLGKMQLVQLKPLLGALLATHPTHLADD